MSYKHNILKERFDILIDTANAVKKGEFELDKNAETLFAIAITSDSDDNLKLRGSQKIQINDQELFPEDFESRLLMADLSVPPDFKTARIGCVNTGNGKVEIWFKDTPHPAAPFSPYRVSFYFFSRVKKTTI